MAENAVAALEETGIYPGSTVHGGERGYVRGSRVVLAMDPPQTVALDLLLDLLERDSPQGIHAMLEYRTGVAGKVDPTLTGSPWPPTEAPCLSCMSMWNAWWGRLGDY